MSTFIEQDQVFIFPEDWQVEAYESTDHAKKTMQNFRFHVRVERHPQEIWSAKKIAQVPIDFVAIIPATKTLLLIEVKDYRRRIPNESVLPSHLADQVAWKTRDTLAGLAIAASRTTSDLHTFAQQAMTCSKIRVVLDLRWPPGVDARARLHIERALRQMLGQVVDEVDVADGSVEVLWRVGDRFSEPVRPHLQR